MRKQNEMDDPKLTALREMTLFIGSHVGMSYNDLKAYAYENDKHDWLDALRVSNYRNMIAQCLREKRKIDDVPYSNKWEESARSRLNAKEEYEQRNPLSFIGIYANQEDDHKGQ